MSKSYKKTPRIWYEKPNTKQQNRIVRRAPLTVDFTKPADFKKYKPDLDGCWWGLIWAEKDAIKQWENGEVYDDKFKTLEEWLEYYKRCTRRK